VALSILGNVLIDERRRFYAVERDARLERSISDNISELGVSIELSGSDATLHSVQASVKLPPFRTE
jgi:hypothetical protein